MLISLVIACGAILALLVPAWHYIQNGPAITTDPGEWDQQMLADGTVVHLGPNTTLRLRFGDQQRAVVLQQGEALFEVARDPLRPFVVATDYVEVRAVGTAFGVTHRAAEPTVITVAEGKVMVRRPGVVKPGAETVEMIMTAGQQFLIAKDVHALRRVDVASALRWAHKVREFKGVTIGEVAAEFNRRNSLQVVISDPSIASMNVGLLVLPLDDPELFASVLAARSDIAVVREDSRLVLSKE